MVTRRRPKKTSGRSNGERVLAAVPGARRAALPRKIEAQLAKLTTAAPAGDSWLHEIKYDGYRMLARLDRGKAQLFSRNQLDWTSRLRPVADAIGQLPARSAILDGEVVVLDAEGISRFQLLQNSLNGAAYQSIPWTYFVFDLLYLDGYDLRPVTLAARKELLAGLLGPRRESSLVRFSDHIVGNGPRFYRRACKLGLEGIISKRSEGSYQAGRSSDWLKVKCRFEQELVIGGYTDPAGSRRGFGSLLVGYFENRKLRYAGRVGTGFNDRLLEELAAKLVRLARKASPFVDPPRFRKVHWVKPVLVAEVKFSNWTDDGLVRQGAFVGLREDKPASAVRRETASG
jgi:bifunctional non-homologous end joining protein LigD